MGVRSRGEHEEAERYLESAATEKMIETLLQALTPQAGGLWVEQQLVEASALPRDEC